MGKKESPRIAEKQRKTGKLPTVTKQHSNRYKHALSIRVLLKHIFFLLFRVHVYIRYIQAICLSFPWLSQYSLTLLPPPAHSPHPFIVAQWGQKLAELWTELVTWPCASGHSRGESEYSGHGVSRRRHSQHSSSRSGSHIPPTPSAGMVLEARVGGWCKCSFRAEHSSGPVSQFLDQLWISALTSTTEKNLLWPRWRAALIYGYKHTNI